MKFFLAEESRACFQPAGQAIRTALCFIPPSPADWMSREKPSRRLDATTTWEKPFVRSAAMAAFRFCKWSKEKDGGKKELIHMIKCAQYVVIHCLCNMLEASHLLVTCMNDYISQSQIKK